MGIVAIISTINPVPTGPLANALIFAIFLWVIAFGCTWSSVSILAISRLHPRRDELSV